MTIWLNRLCSFWLIASAVILIAYWTDWIPHWEAGAFSGWILGVSLFTFLIQGLDKLQSRGPGRRVPEKWLHLLELIGGWPGAHLGQQLYRHKTVKPSYRRIFFLMVALHVIGVLLAFIYLQRGES